MLGLASTHVGDSIVRRGLIQCHQLVKINLSHTRITDQGTAPPSARLLKADHLCSLEWLNRGVSFPLQVWSTWKTCVWLRSTWTAPALVWWASPTSSPWLTSAASAPPTLALFRWTMSQTRTEVSLFRSDETNIGKPDRSGLGNAATGTSRKWRLVKHSSDLHCFSSSCLRR